MLTSVIVVSVLLCLLAVGLGVWFLLPKGAAPGPAPTQPPGFRPLPSLPPVPGPVKPDGPGCPPEFKLVGRTCKPLCGSEVCTGDERCVSDKCLPACGAGTCAADQACVTLENVDCRDALYRSGPSVCSTALGENKNCILSCTGEPGKATATLCHQQGNCKYDPSAVQPFPRGASLGTASTLYPAYVPSEWDTGPDAKPCFDAYKGLDDRSYCLSDVLLSNLESHPADPAAALDELQSVDLWNKTIRTMGQSEKGYYCIPKDETGWRYSLFPAPQDVSQCTATDCLMHALSSQSVAKVWHDHDSKACMSASCVGQGCSQIKCSSADGSCATSETSGVAKACPDDVAGAKKECEQNNPTLTCGGLPASGVQMWVKDSDKVKVYFNEICTKTNDTSESIWADGPTGPRFWERPDYPTSSFVDGRTAFEWWKNKTGGVQFRAEHFGDRDLGDPLKLKEPPGHGLNEVFFNWYGCTNPADVTHWGNPMCWQEQVDCMQSDDDCAQNDKCPKDLADGKCLSWRDAARGGDCPAGEQICNDQCRDYSPKH